MQKSGRIGFITMKQVSKRSMSSLNDSLQVLRDQIDNSLMHELTIDPLSSKEFPNRFCYFFYLHKLSSSIFKKIS